MGKISFLKIPKDGVTPTEIPDVIPNGLLAPVMRHSMENKNLLNKKGSIYVGTGQVHTLADDTGANTFEIAKTSALEIPTGMENGAVLVTDSNQANGITWSANSLKSQVINLVSANWTAVTGNAAGAYQCVISSTGSSILHKLGNTPNILVQIAVPQGTDGTYEIVNTTIDIGPTGVITIFSNIQTNARVYLLAIG